MGRYEVEVVTAMSAWRQAWSSGSAVKKGPVVQELETVSSLATMLFALPIDKVIVAIVPCIISPGWRYLF